MWWVVSFGESALNTHRPNILWQQEVASAVRKHQKTAELTGESLYATQY